MRFSHPQDSKVYLNKLKHGFNCRDNTKYSIEDIQFEHGCLFAHMCTLCNFVQLKKENIEKHLYCEHNRPCHSFEDILKFEIVNHKSLKPFNSEPPELIKEAQDMATFKSSAPPSADHSYSIAVSIPKKENIEILLPLTENTSNDFDIKPITTTNLMTTKLTSFETSKIINKYSSTINKKNSLKIWSSQPSTKQITCIRTMLGNDCLFNLYKCMNNHCSYSTSNELDARSHFQSHLTNSFECCYCDNIFIDPNELVDHINTLHGTSSYSCHMCFYRSISPYNCIIHQVIYFL